MKNERNTTLDVVKGISLLSLPAIHSALMYGKPGIEKTLPGKILAIIAEYTGAPIFMLTMGTAVGLGKKKSISNIFLRSGKLLLLGYALNFLKFVVPGKLGLLPDKMLEDSQIPEGKEGLRQLLQTGDILHLAAISSLVCCTMRRSKNYPAISLVAAILVTMLSPCLRKLKLYSLLNGTPPKTFFPVFPWMAYPLFGLAVADILKRQIRQSYVLLGACGLTAMTLSYLLSKKEAKSLKENFYILGPSGTLYHVAFAVLMISICGLSDTGGVKGRFKKLILLLSRNITVNYMIQWVIVFWLLPVFGYRKSGSRKVLFTAIFNTIFSIGLTRLLSKKDRSNSIYYTFKTELR